jgi:hypothetical protein
LKEATCVIEPYLKELRVDFIGVAATATAADCVADAAVADGRCLQIDAAALFDLLHQHGNVCWL